MANLRTNFGQARDSPAAMPGTFAIVRQFKRAVQHNQHRSPMGYYPENGPMGRRRTRDRVQSPRQISALSSQSQGRPLLDGHHSEVVTTIKLLLKHIESHSIDRHKTINGTFFPRKLLLG